MRAKKVKDVITQSLTWPQIHLRLNPELLALLDDYRRKLPDVPKRQEAIKRLIAATAEQQP